MFSWQGGPLALLLAVALTTGCTPSAQPAVQGTATLAPYRTPGVTASPVYSTPSSSATPTPVPTPTPRTHTVQKGETMLGIALSYGVQLEVLLAANPGVDPRLLSIGQALIVPAPETSAQEALPPTAMPSPLVVGAVSCYTTASAGRWCLARVANPLQDALEGISLEFILIDGSGTPLATVTSDALLSLLPPGATVALAAFFAQPPPHAAGATALVRTAFSSPSAVERYLTLQVERSTEDPSPDGEVWRVAGSAILQETVEGRAARVSVLAIGWDVEGNPVGVRKTEGEVALEVGSALRFDLTVYSLGGPIAEVTLLAE